ncbi:hypothetical protein HYS95_03240 [Candidatus Daviesbacteria bacterium]|nr:hypothetical protein [Candidatus Daviesbacteria bacterium]
MKKIAAVLPELDKLFKCNPVNNPGADCPSIPKVSNPPTFNNLADFISPLLNIAFYAAAFLAFFWLAWGAYAYIMAQGKKEDLAKARARITWALIGLVFVVLAFSITKFVSEIFGPTTGGLPF